MMIPMTVAIAQTGAQYKLRVVSDDYEDDDDDYDNFHIDVDDDDDDDDAEDNDDDTHESGHCPDWDPQHIQ